MAGAKMGGGPGKAGIYDPRGKAKEKAGAGGYWPSVQADLTKKERERLKGKNYSTKKIGR